MYTIGSGFYNYYIVFQKLKLIKQGSKEFNYLNNKFHDFH